jgi:phosphoribosylanthranilate isomerase
LNRTRVKICGITRPEDAFAAATAGADAIGMVFYPGSQRCISIETANAIIASLPPFVTTVGLFVDASRDQVNSVLRNVSLDMLQFHGNESQQDCLGYAKPYIKAIRMKADLDLMQQLEIYDKSAGLLLDTYVQGVAGGTGQTFNWDIIPANLDKPLILAGGLNAGNVADAIRRVRPYAVDVSGGVEAAVGIKDAGKLTEFIQETRKFGSGSV